MPRSQSLLVRAGRAAVQRIAGAGRQAASNGHTPVLAASRGPSPAAMFAGARQGATSFGTSAVRKQEQHEEAGGGVREGREGAEEGASIMEQRGAVDEESGKLSSKISWAETGWGRGEQGAMNKGGDGGGSSRSTESRSYGSMAKRRQYVEQFVSRQVYVGNVASSTSPQELAALFRQGFPDAVAGAFVSGVADKGSLTYGFVEFESEASVDQAVAKFDRTTFGENMIKVKERSAKKRERGRSGTPVHSKYESDLGIAVEVKQQQSAAKDSSAGGNASDLFDKIVWDDAPAGKTEGGKRGGGDQAATELGGGGGGASQGVRRKDRESSVYVTKIPVTVNEIELIELFQTIDEAADVNFFRDHSNSHAFVQLTNPELAQEAVDKLDCTIMHGDNICVAHRNRKYARTPLSAEEKEEKEARTVWIGRFGDQVNASQLCALFKNVDGAAEVDFLQRGQGSFRYAFVTLSSRDKAIEAMRSLNGAEIDAGEPVHITLRKPLTVEEKRQHAAALGRDADSGNKVSSVTVKRFPRSMTAAEVAVMVSVVDEAATVSYFEENGERDTMALVRLSSRDKAHQAVERLNGTTVQGCTLEVALKAGAGAGTSPQSRKDSKGKGSGGAREAVWQRAQSGVVRAPMQFENEHLLRAVENDEGEAGWEAAEAASGDGDEADRWNGERSQGAGGGNSAKSQEGGSKLEARLKTVFVGNLPYEVTHAEVKDHFGAAGPVMFVEMPTEVVPTTEGASQMRNKGFCFVRFETKEAAAEAIEKFDGSKVRGQEVEVAQKVKRPPSVTMRYLRRQPQEDDGEEGVPGDGEDKKMTLLKEVYVCGLPLDATREELESLFREVGSVTSIRGPLAGPKMVTKGAMRFETGFGFVRYEDESSVQAAVDLLSGQRVRNSTITVRARWPIDGSAQGDSGSVDWGSNWREPVMHKGDHEGLYGGRFGGSVEQAEAAAAAAAATAPHQHDEAAAEGAPPVSGGGEGGGSLLSAMDEISWDASPLENPVGGTHEDLEEHHQGDASDGSGSSQHPHMADGQQHAAIDDAKVLYLNGLSWRCDDGALTEFCQSQVQGVTRAMVVSDIVPTVSGEKSVKKSRGYGFVWFSSAEQAMEAMPVLDGALVDGRVIQARPRARSAVTGGVDSAGREGEERHDKKGHHGPSESTPEEKERQVFVGNVAFQATKDDVKEHFEELGFTVLRVTMPVDTVRTPEGMLEDKSRGFCFITFEDSETVNEAVDTAEGTEFMGRRVFVTRRARTEGKQPESRSTGGGGGGVDAGGHHRTGDGPPRVMGKRSVDVDLRTLYCSRFLLDTTPEEITELFTEAGGRVTNVYMPTVLTMTKDGPTRMSKGFAFVTFPSEEGVAAALRLDGESFNGCKLVVRRKMVDQDQEEEVAGDAGAGKEKRPGTTNLLDGLDLEALKRQHMVEQGVRDEDDVDVQETATHHEEGEAEPAAMAQKQEGEGRGQAEGSASAVGSTPEDEVQEEEAARKPKEAVPQPKRSGRQAKQRKQADAKTIRLAEGMTIKQLADEMGVRLVDVIKHLIKLGEEPQTISDQVSIDAQEYLVTECGFLPQLPEGAESARLGRIFSDEEYAELPEKSPIVTIMGHVDHGKTTLLDFLRNSSVAAGEAGGITQSISAFEVERPGLGRICFVDTPGHQAFSAMRERGTRATDIVILVVSATDGVQPQTIEVIQHARAAQVPLIIAVNKCDLKEADPGRVISEIAAEGVVVEDLGGDVQSVEVSGLTGKNMDKLEEAVLLLAGMMELRAPKDGPGEGFVVEARKDKSLGAVASVIVTLGEVKVGDHIVVGGEWGKVRMLRDCNKKPAESIGPSSVCEVTGFRGQPTAGEELYVVESEKAAVEHAERLAARKSKAATLSAKQQQQHGQERSGGGGASEEGGEEEVVEVKELAVIVKCDVAGSLEALVGALATLPSHEAKLKIVHADLGPVTQHDVDVAEAAGARIMAFNLHEPTAAVAKSARQRKVEISASKVIYTLLEEVEQSLIDLLPADVRSETVGEAQVLQVFEIKGKAGVPNTLVAGCKVSSGVMQQSTCLQVVRNGELVHEGQLQSLRHHKDVVKEVKEGSECGVVVQGFEGCEEGDEIKCINRVHTKRTKL